MSKNLFLHQIPLRKNPNSSIHSQSSTSFSIHLHSSTRNSFNNSINFPFRSNSCLETSKTHRDWFVTTCVNLKQTTQELVEDEDHHHQHVAEEEDDSREEDEVGGRMAGNGGEKHEVAEQSMWDQKKEIVMFTGPAAGLWICRPLMSLIDTVGLFEVQRRKYSEENNPF